MRLYRYMRLDNLWRLLDLVVENRIHCATWDSLNDPLEGSYEVMIDKLTPDQRLRLEESLEVNRHSWRIASFSAPGGHPNSPTCGRVKIPHLTGL
jgi:hypothetical protein